MKPRFSKMAEREPLLGHVQYDESKDTEEEDDQKGKEARVRFDFQNVVLVIKCYGKKLGTHCITIDMGLMIQ